MLKYAPLERVIVRCASALPARSAGSDVWRRLRSARRTTSSGRRVRAHAAAGTGWPTTSDAAARPASTTRWKRSTASAWTSSSTARSIRSRVDVARERDRSGVSPVDRRNRLDRRGRSSSSQDDCDERARGDARAELFGRRGLMMKLAAEAALVLPHVEIIEMHHDAEARQAQRNGEADRGSGSRKPAGRQHVPIHSVRLTRIRRAPRGALRRRRRDARRSVTIRSRANRSAGDPARGARRRQQPGLTIGLESLLFTEVRS